MRKDVVEVKFCLQSSVPVSLFSSFLCVVLSLKADLGIGFAEFYVRVSIFVFSFTVNTTGGSRKLLSRREELGSIIIVLQYAYSSLVPSRLLLIRGICGLFVLRKDYYVIEM